MHAHTRAHTHTHAHAHTRTRAHTHTHTHARTHARTNARTHAHTIPSPGDIVTDTDKASEAVCVEVISKAFPGHAILGEEGSEARRGVQG